MKINELVKHPDVLNTNYRPGFGLYCGWINHKKRYFIIDLSCMNVWYSGIKKEIESIYYNRNIDIFSNINRIINGSKLND